MNRIEVNVTTGERKVIDLTPEEILEIQSRPKQIAAAVDKRRAAIDALILQAASSADAPPEIEAYAAELTKSVR